MRLDKWQKLMYSKRGRPLPTRGELVLSKQMKANLLLVLTALIWGVAFVAQDVAADALPPLTFNALRMAVAALALTPTVWLNDRKSTAFRWKTMDKPSRGLLLKGGFFCGVMLSLGSAFQQLGISLGTGAGKAGFITALYIVLVPLIGALGGRRVGRLVWIAVALSVGGLYLLCMQGSLSIDPGDGMLILCALSYSGHILVVDCFSRKTDCLKMSWMQFGVCALFCALGALLFEQPTWQGVRACVIPILYAGVLSGAVGYTLQIIAQRDAEPTVASLLMSLESVFAVLAGWVILGDLLSLRELAGCLLMMGGIVLAQLPEHPSK